MRHLLTSIMLMFAAACSPSIDSDRPDAGHTDAASGSRDGATATDGGLPPSDASSTDGSGSTDAGSEEDAGGCPGEPTCTDAFGNEICPGEHGSQSCRTDGVQRCLCDESGNWTDCGPCIV